MWTGLLGVALSAGIATAGPTWSGGRFGRPLHYEKYLDEAAREQLSGIAWDGENTLWLVQNGPGKGSERAQVWRMRRASADAGWQEAEAFDLPDLGCNRKGRPTQGDNEAILPGPTPDTFWLLNEKAPRSCETPDDEPEERPSIRLYGLNGTSAEVREEWPLPSSLAEVGRKGAEGLTWIPDSDLSGLLGGDPIPEGFLPGVFVVGHQKGGLLHLFRLSEEGGRVQQLRTFASGRKETAGLEYDGVAKKLLAMHSACHNQVEVMALETCGTGSDRTVHCRRRPAAPQLRPEVIRPVPAHSRFLRRKNLEGVALVDQHTVWLTDDGGGTNALTTVEVTESQWQEPMGGIDGGSPKRDVCEEGRQCAAQDASDLMLATSLWLGGVTGVATIGSEAAHGSGERGVVAIAGPLAGFALTGLTKGRALRPRPLTYSEAYREEHPWGPDDKDHWYSFFSGHTSTAALSTFYTASAYTYLNPEPDPRISAGLFAGATLWTVSMGALRERAGKHFVTDVLVGGVVGATTGFAGPALASRLPTRAQGKTVEQTTGDAVVVRLGGAF